MLGRLQDGVEFRIHLRDAAGAASVAETLGRTSDDDADVLVRCRTVGAIVQRRETEAAGAFLDRVDGAGVGG